jgi:LysR family transcriptional regulator of abg operon
MITFNNTTSLPALLKMRFGHLRLLAALGDTGSVRRAATQLNLTQPAVSKALKEIEQIFGTQLYERSVQGVVPTAAGIAAAHGARLLLAELDLLAKQVRAAGSQESVQIRLGISPYLGASMLPGILARLIGPMQLGQLHLEEDWTPVLIDRLVEGSLDLLVMMGALEMVPALDNPSLVRDRLCEEKIVIVAAPNHPLATRRKLGLADLVDERWMLGLEPSQVRRLLAQAFIQAGLKPVSPAVEARTLSTLIESAAAGLGITALPERVAESLLPTKRIVRLNLQPSIALPPILLVHRRLLDKNSRLAAFADALRREFRAYGATSS